MPPFLPCCAVPCCDVLCRAVMCSAAKSAVEEGAARRGLAPGLARIVVSELLHDPPPGVEGPGEVRELLAHMVSGVLRV